MDDPRSWHWPGRRYRDDGRVECIVCAGRYKPRQDGLPRGHAGPQQCRQPRLRAWRTFFESRMRAHIRMWERNYRARLVAGSDRLEEIALVAWAPMVHQRRRGDCRMPVPVTRSIHRLREIHGRCGMTDPTMTTDCTYCYGSRSIECDQCGDDADCLTCAGRGEIECPACEHPTCKHPGCGPGHDCEGQRSVDAVLAEVADLPHRDCWHWMWLGDCVAPFYDLPCTVCRGEDVGGLPDYPWPEDEPMDFGRYGDRYGPEASYHRDRGWAPAECFRTWTAMDQWQADPTARLAGLLREREWDGGSPMSRDRESACCIPLRPRLFHQYGLIPKEQCGCRACWRSMAVEAAVTRLKTHKEPTP